MIYLGGHCAICHTQLIANRTAANFPKDQSSNDLNWMANNVNMLAETVQRVTKWTISFSNIHRDNVMII